MQKSVLNSKIKLLKRSAGTKKCYAQRNTPGNAISQNSAKIGVPLQVYNLNHVILVLKCKFRQQTVYYDQMFNIRIKIRHAKDAF